MAIQKTETFVLRVQPFRSSSLILTTFSRNYGKVKGVVKGVRREGQPRPSTYEPFNLLEIIFYEKIRSEIHLISESTILETFEELRRDLESLATAYYLAELVDQLTESFDPHESIFELLHFVFRSLPAFPSSFLARFFEIRLLHEVGLLPHVESCISCGQKDPPQAYFSVRQGGIFCFRCRNKSPEARLLVPGILQTMQIFIEQGTHSVEGFTFDEKIERGMRELVERFLAERLGKPLASRRFLNQVQFLRTRAVNRQSSIQPGR